jgi:multiple sugar transport system permease protein
MLDRENRWLKNIKYLVLIIIAITILFPILFMIANSFMDKNEILSAYNNLLNISQNKEFIKFKMIPDYFNLAQYYNAFFRKPDFLIAFWNSIILSVPIVIGQVFISCPAAYAFAKLKFPIRDQIYFLFIVLMLMPYQVTEVPNYIVMRKLGLIGSYSSVILPGIFATFGVFLLKQFIKTIPDEQCEAAKVDGAGYITVFIKIILPQCKAALASLTLLSFIDNWNMLEKPLIFLDSFKFPLSNFLANSNYTDLGVAFACGIIFMLPTILLYLYVEKDLVEGIQSLELK